MKPCPNDFLVGLGNGCVLVIPFWIFVLLAVVLLVEASTK